MRSVVTSYLGLFGLEVEGVRVERVEVPLIQRDYAQGRPGPRVARVRRSFLDAIHAAVTGGEPLHLDFVYGDVTDGTLRPLDGQQRLTTLFLLHWYLAHRAGRGHELPERSAFGYAVRPTARLFCERLGDCVPPPGPEPLSAWMEDQPWFLYTWRQDATIQSMLVMLDAIQERFDGADVDAAWSGLTRGGASTVTFHLLPMEEPGTHEDLYIKMNSRGKPLTPFENFKALFERTVSRTDPERAKDLAHRIDGVWSDVFWPHRGDDQLIDDEVMRYLHFVTELAEWRRGRPATASDVETLAHRVYGAEAEDARAQLDHLFACFDVWKEVDTAAFFAEHFSLDAGTETVRLFSLPDDGGVDLFGLCCRVYGEARGQGRRFNLPTTLLLAATLRHLIAKTPSFTPRARVLRNLLEASSNEIRLDRMPQLIADVDALIERGAVGEVSALNKAQAVEEEAKARLLRQHPEVRDALHALEDHELLKGNLAALELDPETLPRHAEAFARVFSKEHWPRVTAALLTFGDYSRSLGRSSFRFGSGAAAEPWTAVLTGGNRSQLDDTRRSLARLLDHAAAAEDLASELDRIVQRWLAEREAERRLDWRYYLVKYDAMREGRSGLYVSEEPTMGYRLCMLHKRRLNSNYRDPFLQAVHRESGVGDAIEDKTFTGYPNRERWLPLARSGAALRCVDEGFLLRAPADEEHRRGFERVCGEQDVSDGILRVEQATHEGRPIDAEDRVEKAARFVKSLVDDGL